MRLNDTLEAILSYQIAQYFPEAAPHRGQISIGFGRKARTRLGSIRQIGRFKKQSIITINGLFREETIPEEIITATVAHELCHFVQGFSSPLPQQSAYPHQGGLVDNELKRRGLGDLLKFQKKWLKSEWPAIVKANFKPTIRRARRARFVIKWF